MEINWRAVLTGFVVAVVLGLFTSWVYPPAQTTGFGLALPGLIGGFVAGYMVSGIERGAVHGGLATIVGALAVLAILVVVGLLFVGLVPAITGSVLGIIALFMMAIPGAIAGAVGGWLKGRSEARSSMATPP